MLSQLRGNAALLEQQLGDGRDFVLGSAPGWADIACYFPVWMARTFVPPAARAARRQRAHARMGSARARHRPRTAHRHRCAARRSTSRGMQDAGRKRAASMRDDPLNCEQATRVSVSPDDYGKVPVIGELWTLTLDEVAVQTQRSASG